MYIYIYFCTYTEREFDVMIYRIWLYLYTYAQLRCYVVLFMTWVYLRNLAEWYSNCAKTYQKHEFKLHNSLHLKIWCPWFLLLRSNQLLSIVAGKPMVASLLPKKKRSPNYYDLVTIQVPCSNSNTWIRFWRRWRPGTLISGEENGVVCGWCTLQGTKKPSCFRNNQWLFLVPLKVVGSIFHPPGLARTISGI